MGGKLLGAGEQNGPSEGGAFGSSVALSEDAGTAVIGGVYYDEERGAVWTSGPAGAAAKEEAPKGGPPVEVIKGGGPAAIAPARIAAALGAALVPSGKAAKIASLLKHGGLSVKVSALEPGSATVSWYLVPPGAKLAKHAKPVLIASGRLAFPAAGSAALKLKLTSAGKKLLRHARRLKLTALATFTPTGAAAVRTSRAFTLKR